MYAYLNVKEGYDHESLKAYKSLEGFRLHWDDMYKVSRPTNPHSLATILLSSV